MRVKRIRKLGSVDRVAYKESLLNLLKEASGSRDGGYLKGLLDEYLTAGDRVLWACFMEHGHLAGLLGLILSGSRGIIGHIAVEPGFRKQGIGRLLIDFVMSEHRLPLLEAETDKEAAGFYQACGFSVRSLGEKYSGVERFLCEKHVN